MTRGVVAAILALGVIAPEAQRVPLRSSVELTVVTATVRDENGKLVTGLPREAFEVYEDSAPVAIAQFTNERVPLGLGLLLDISDSMFGRRIKDAEAAVEQFLTSLLDPADAFFVMAFNHQPRVLFGWKTAPDGVHDALTTPQAHGIHGDLRRHARGDAVSENRPRERRDRPHHRRRRHGERRDAPRSPAALVRSDAFRFTPSRSTRPEPHISKRVNVETLNEITGQSGGRTEVGARPPTSRLAAASIAEELNHQHVLATVAAPGDGQYHSIRVRTIERRA
jgi:hypothetical protein